MPHISLNPATGKVDESSRDAAINNSTARWKRVEKPR